MKKPQTTNTKTRGRRRKSKVQVGVNVIVDNKLHEVAEVLSATGTNAASPSEIEKPLITVYRIKNGKTLKNNPIYVANKYRLDEAA